MKYHQQKVWLYLRDFRLHHSHTLKINSGSKTEPCGTPAVVCFGVDMEDLIKKLLCSVYQIIFNPD